MYGGRSGRESCEVTGLEQTGDKYCAICTIGVHGSSETGVYQRLGRSSFNTTLEHILSANTVPYYKCSPLIGKAEQSVCPMNDGGVHRPRRYKLGCTARI